MEGGGLKMFGGRDFVIRDYVITTKLEIYEFCTLSSCVVLSSDIAGPSKKFKLALTGYFNRESLLSIHPNSPKNSLQSVRCYDVDNGYRCGPCPPGFTGNGVTCKPANRCAENPCWSGVQCVNIETSPGYICGPCPPGFSGNGTVCEDIDEVSFPNEFFNSSQDI
ncbi:thrombospondin-4 [Trichonephila clavipes]|nr:thrombospondin-4 [Trichonephila clavipes]